MSYLNSVLLASGLNPATFQIWAYKGCTKLDVAEALAKFIGFVSPHTKILLYRDSDYLNDDFKTHFKQQALRRNVHAFFPPGVDIEGVFCRANHLQNVNPAHSTAIAGLINVAKMDLEPEFRIAARKGGTKPKSLIMTLGSRSGIPAEQALSAQL